MRREHDWEKKRSNHLFSIPHVSTFPQLHLVIVELRFFLAVQDSSIGDLVTQSVRPSVRDF